MVRNRPVSSLVAVVVTSLAVALTAAPSRAGDTAEPPTATDDAYSHWGFLDDVVLDVLENDVAADGGALALYDVSETTSPYDDTTVRINDAGEMVVNIGAFDSGDTIYWTYRVQDASGQVSEPATVALYVMRAKEIKAKRFNDGRKARFKNPNPFDAQIKLAWSFNGYPKKYNKVFIVPAGSEVSARMHKRRDTVIFIAKALPWKKIFWTDDV